MTRYLYGLTILLAVSLLGAGIIGAQIGNDTINDQSESNHTLDQSRWTALTLFGEALPEDVQIDAAFTEGRISGSAACNRYFSSYERDSSAISFGMVGMTMMGCPEPLMQIDTLFTLALEQTTSYQITSNQLVFFDADGGELVRFNPA